MRNRMKNQLGSSRMDTVLKMLLIAFISLLAFSSGVYFGKQLSDSDYQLKALESDYNHSTVKQTAENEEEPAAEEHLAEEDVAALSEKLVNNEKLEMAEADHGESRKVASNDHGDHGGHEAHAAPPAAPKAHPQQAASHAAKAAPATKGHDDHAPAAQAHAAPAAKAGAVATRPDLSAAAKAAQRVANNAAPIEAAKPQPESRVPSSLPKTVGASQDVEFTVQVASYPTPEAAKDHANELVKKGFPAFPVEASVNGKVWYRVSVGSFRTQKDATTYRAQLLKQTALPSAIVQKIQR